MNWLLHFTVERGYLFRYVSVCSIYTRKVTDYGGRFILRPPVRVCHDILKFKLFLA